MKLLLIHTKMAFMLWQYKLFGRQFRLLTRAVVLLLGIILYIPIILWELGFLYVLYMAFTNSTVLPVL